MGNNYNAAVVGAGPGGLSSVAALLNAGAQKILCVDPTWRGGRLNGLYRDISSNTTVAIYLKAIHFSDTLRSIIDSTPAPNAVTKLESMDHSSTCQLSVAGDMICLLIEGLLARPEVEKLTTTVDGAHLELMRHSERHLDHPNNALNLRPQSPPHYLLHRLPPANLHNIQSPQPNLKRLDLDDCMRRSHLPSILPTDKPSTVAVVDNSHSGVLVVRNLYEIAESGERALRSINFHRRPIRYAIYTDDGIFDNTGLKGATAEWAREVLEKDPDPDILQSVCDCEDEDHVLGEYLP
ncbi:hypothetical protein AbraIFM66950_006164 [Aspergillus brasiliensis]|nr:hypothetical protein AbraIFM66950_006164 [Aspergillus brasiliensis]